MIDETAPNPERAALLTIDMQNDFALVGAPAFIPGTLDVATAIGRLAEGFRSRGRPIVHVIDCMNHTGPTLSASAAP